MIEPQENGKLLIMMGAWVVMWLFIAPAWLWAQSGPALEVGKISASEPGGRLPDGWKPWTC